MIDEQFFWERISGMPMFEAEQELVFRKEGILLENAMLAHERACLLESRGKKNEQEANRIGVAISENCALMTKISERIKYLRRAQDSIQWRKAVVAIFGQDGYEACAVWVAQNDEAQDWRREWSGAKDKPMNFRTQGANP